ncbi:JAB domain-containing protein [Elizabethkingia anophelis]|uniref:RadC domain-containing protein n=1 Tax=Elizabethkingia anophelis TaxID=1117645 RepID=A0A455ZIE9_9FLAO|nr:JAB domain-containing protein [Elizabethkingia anophelis]DAC76445.1 TPA_exp: RadC domain-containing protein [Elizabethkingia anophelis]
MNQAEQYIYGQNTNFGFPKNQETRYIKTSEGKELPYELFTNASSNSGSSIIREETHSGYSTDFALVQRQYIENKQLSFIAGTKIQNINDVAWLFRSLEDEAIEHAFILFRFKDNSYMVQQLSSGGITGTVVDLRLVAGNAFALNPSSITLVHNHPSGNLVSSNEDRNILRKLQDIFEGSDIQVEDGIVINLRSGKYLVFNENEDGDRIKELKNQYEQQSNVSIYSFSKQIFATNYQPQKITGPEDVAAFISTQKFGISDKTEALILNNANEIVGKFILPQHKQFEKLVELMTVHAGAGTVLYGNNISKAMFNDYNKRLSPIGFKLLDAILLQSNNYYSLVQNEIIFGPQYTEFKINNANEDPHIDFRVGEEDSSLKYANNNYQNTKNMNISSLNWVEKLLLHNTKPYKDFVKNISNHKEIKANSEQEKKFLEVYYNRELKKDNPNNFLFSARTLNEKKQTTQINNFINGSETEMFLKNIDFNNKVYLFKDIKHQNEIIISNPVLVSGILKELDDYKKEHNINNHTDRFQDVEAAFLSLKSKQKRQTHNLESHPYSIAEGNWIKNQEKYTNLTPKYAVSILSQNNGEKKLHFIDNRNQNVIVIDNAAITQKVISDLYAKELEKRTDLGKGLTNTQIDEKQALHYRNYEAEAKKLGIPITPNIDPSINPIEEKEKFFIIEDLQITPEQRDPENEWEDPEQLTDEQLNKIPDELHGFELMYSHKRDLALGALEFRRNGVFFSIEPDRKILMTYLDEETNTHKKHLTVNDVKFINQKIETSINRDFGLENQKDGFEHIPQELEEVMEKWQEKIENGLDYNDCANFQKDCNTLGYTFDYGLDAMPFDLRKIDLNEHNINNQNTKIMTTQNTDFNQVQYLKDQLKYLQFGEGEKLHKDLEAGINSPERQFQIKTSLDKTLPGNTVEFTLNYNKSEKGGIFLNSYIAELKNKKGEELSHIFNISKENTFDAKEAINLLEGRSVKIEFINPKIEEKQTAFVKLDFNEPKTQYGTYKFQSFHENYGVNTAEIVDKSGLIFDKPEWRDNTIKSLERGNIVNVKFKHEDKEIEGKAFLNPQYKTLNLYDSNMTRINTNKPLEGMGNDNAHDKNNVREQNRSRGI